MRTRYQEFPPSDVQLATICKALAHPARVAILRFLAGTNECFCGDIVSHLPLAQATVSQHLKELKQAGLIQGTVVGQRVCYCINHTEWKKAQQLLSQLECL